MICVIISISPTPRRNGNDYSNDFVFPLLPFSLSRSTCSVRGGSVTRNAWKFLTPIPCTSPPATTMRWLDWSRSKMDIALTVASPPNGTLTVSYAACAASKAYGVARLRHISTARVNCTS